MKIDHISMYVSDLERAKEFWCRYFGAKSNDMYHNPRTGLKTYFLTFEDRVRLEIMTCPDMIDNEKEAMQTGYIHIAINVGSKEIVNSLTETLRNDGYRVISEPRTTGDGYYESCVLDAENNRIEITG